VKYVLLVHLAATLVMVGVIWLVQIVHYLLSCRVGSGGFTLVGVVWLSTALLQVPRHSTTPHIS
jgi:hypothetical protein